jgi:hypothetical protein
MSFDWQHFLDSHGIPYATSGKNVKKGWWNIQCPFCGSNDRSMHMGLGPEGGWACWRDPLHRGRSVPKLIAAALGCTWAKACDLAGDWEEPGPVESWDLAHQVQALDDLPQQDRPQPIHYPHTAFFSIQGQHKASTPFQDHLLRRGFREQDLYRICGRYRLRGCTTGRWAGRLLLPILGRKDQVYGWQGRALSRRAQDRYISYPGSEVVKQLLFNYGPAYDAAERDVLVIVEGPFGCLKVDWYGLQAGVRAVGTMGVSFVSAQVSLLYTLAARYDRTLILFDPGAEVAAYDLASRLSHFTPAVGHLPEDLDGPDDLSPSRVLPVVRSCLR